MYYHSVSPLSFLRRFFYCHGKSPAQFLSVSISHYSYISTTSLPVFPFCFCPAIQGLKIFVTDGFHSLRISMFCRVSLTMINLRTPWWVVFLLLVFPRISFLGRLFVYPVWNHGYKLAPYKTHNFHYSQYIPTEHHTKAFSFLHLFE